MIHCERRGRTINGSIAGNTEELAREYAIITKQLLDDKDGQAILERATEILEKIMKENDDEEKR